MIKWQSYHSQSKSSSANTYDLPFCMSHLRSMKWTRWLPICPTFGGFMFSKNMKEEVVNNGHDNDGRPYYCNEQMI